MAKNSSLVAAWTRAINRTDTHARACDLATADNPTGCPKCRRYAKQERRIIERIQEAGIRLPL